MNHIDVLKESSLSRQDIEQFTPAISDQEFGALALDWCELFRQNPSQGFSLEYYTIREEGTLLAVGIVHHLKALNLAHYLGPNFQKIDRLSMRLLKKSPFVLDFHFLEVPMANAPGIYVRSNIDLDRRTEMIRAIASAARKEYSSGLFAAKVDAAHAHDCFRKPKLKLAWLSFLPNTLLDLPGRSFDDFLAKLDGKTRSVVRRNIRIFEDSGCKFEVKTHLSDEELHIICSLYDSLLQRHKNSGHMQVPIRPYFEWLKAAQVRLGEKMQTILAIKDGKTIGFFCSFTGGGTSYLKVGGIDESVSRETLCYFNLYYECIRQAYRQGTARISGGATTYEVKKRMNFKLMPTAYGIGLGKLNLHPIGKVAPLLFRKEFTDSAVDTEQVNT